ncbi:MAG: type II toxin-antitoxin system RelE/ParE family toxin [Candidatus Shapirobacteria bacterium]|nr:type II toxin-antitoxin system RelE/ParE family toxin [Candidatus Shapirobacteria bacterium]
MDIIIRNEAQKQIKKLPPVELKKIIKKIKNLSLEPDSGKQLKGEFTGLFSLRAWPYRIIYQIAKNKIIIFSVAHRQSAYKQ